METSKYVPGEYFCIVNKVNVLPLFSTFLFFFYPNNTSTIDRICRFQCSFRFLTSVLSPLTTPASEPFPIYTDFWKGRQGQREKLSQGDKCGQQSSNGLKETEKENTIQGTKRLFDQSLPNQMLLIRHFCFPLLYEIYCILCQETQLHPRAFGLVQGSPAK